MFVIQGSVDQVVYGVDYIFHAAALKQVPSCEFFPVEAVKTNILGAENVMISAEKYGVKRLVVLSTDKAVYPINAMGMSKAMMEKVMIATIKESQWCRNYFLWNTLWECDGFQGFGDSSVY